MVSLRSRIDVNSVISDLSFCTGLTCHPTAAHAMPMTSATTGAARHMTNVTRNAANNMTNATVCAIGAAENATGVNTNAGVALINIHTSPLSLKPGTRFEIFSTVVNNSPKPITFIAGRCHSPLSADFSRNVLVRHTQGCTAASPSFKLNPKDEVSVAGPSSGTIYQAMTVGQTAATATLHYQKENGRNANVTEPFTFTIS